MRDSATTYQQRLHRLVDQWQAEDARGFDVLASERIDRIRDILNEIQGTPAPVTRPAETEPIIGKVGDR